MARSLPRPTGGVLRAPRGARAAAPGRRRKICVRRKRHRGPRRLSPQGANAPINVLVQGGAGRAGLARDYAFPAETLVRAGAHYVALDFNNVIETGGDLMPLAEQGRRGIASGYTHRETIAGDTRRLYVLRTSSGCPSA